MNAKTLSEYTRFWGATAVPFSQGRKTEALFHTPQTQRALQYLDQTAALRSVMLLSGDSGVGKSTLVKNWLSCLDPKLFLPAIITQSTLSGSGIFSYLLSRLGLPVKIRRSDNLQTLEKGLQNLGERTIIVVLDDAQNYPSTALLEVRLLMELNQSTRPIFSLIMIGDQYLENMLSLQHNRALCSRISVSFQLPKLTLESVKEYLHHRLEQVGIQRECFELASIELLAEASDYNMRQLTLLACRSWLFASEQKAKSITAEHVHEAIQVNPMAKHKILSIRE